MPSYRKIFPSYDWDDVWLVNQIINLPNIVGKEEIGFIKDVPNEEVKGSDIATQRWIDKHMEGCSCLILFCGEKTYTSKWVKYELEKAREKGMGRFIIHLESMRDRTGKSCKKGLDPYHYHGMYSNTGYGYEIKQYYWINNGMDNINKWIEDACHRAGK